MNPFDIEAEKLKESKEIKDERELLKLKLVSEFLKAASKIETEEVLHRTGLHKSDYSRLKTLNISRFSIDRIIGFLDSLGYSTSVNVKPKAS